MDNPKIRKVFPTNTGPGAEKPFYLDDPFGIVSDRFEVSDDELKVMRLMNGKRDLTELEQAFSDLHGKAFSKERLSDLVNRLSESLFLDNDPFRQAYARAQEEFRAWPTRPLRHHSGECYPEDPVAFQEVLDGWLVGDGGPGEVDVSKPGPRTPAVFAPHIDPLLAGPSYAHAYKPAIEDPQNDLFVILGTAHYRDVNPFILTRKSFETPFGTVETDTQFVDDLSTHCGRDLFEDELLQKVEHSIEFQVVLLAALSQRAGGRPFKVVPILVSSFHGLVEHGASPSGTPAIADFLFAFENTLVPRRSRICLVAGVDLAHVGLKFGHDQAPTDQTLRQLETADRKSLQFCCDRDAEGFWSDVMADGNARNVCGVAPMYVATHCLPPCKGEVRSYGRDFQPDQGYAVTFAGVVFNG